MSGISEELRYKILKALQRSPNLSQRELSAALGISLGKVNYCLKALLDVGWIKAKNFKNSQNRLAYAYLLTPKGIEEKSKVTAAFLQRKIAEAEAIDREITDIRTELHEQQISGSDSTPAHEIHAPTLSTNKESQA